MIPRNASTIGALAALALTACSSSPSSTASGGAAPVDEIFVNGRVYTVEEDRPWAEAFAVRDGLFVAVGSDVEIRSLAGPGTRTVDLEGRFTTAGFIDTHFHAVAAAILTAEFDTGDAVTNEEMYAQLREFAATLEGRTEPLVTYGWHLANFPPEGPRKEDLDEIFGDLPVLFIRSDGHAAWANTAALRAANITAETEDPTEQSYYQRDENGEPTGFIEEIPAYFGVYFPMIGELSEAWIEERVAKAFPKFSEAGLTTVFDPGVLFAPSIPAMNAIHAYNEEHGANLRVSMSHYSVNQEDDFAAAQALIANSRSEDVFSDSIKLNVDASIETGTGLLKEPYGGRFEGSTGMTVFPIDELVDLVQRCYGADMNLHFHVVGDAGVDLVLDSLEAAIAEHGAGGPRANLTHVMMIDTADMPRFEAAQAGASFSALWMMPGPSMDDSIAVIGQERADDYYAAGRLVAAGGRAGIGSDYPVATTFPSYRPLDSIEMFVRRARAGDPDAPMQGHEEDKLTLEQALRAATIDNAWMMNKDELVGSIAAGKSADFVVLGRDPFDVQPHEISKIPVEATYYRGRQTHSAK